MGGTDTMRGVGFQHAAAVLACIDAVTDSSVASVTLEGDADVIDFMAHGQDGQVVWARQLKTRAEPAVWTKRDLTRVLALWGRNPHAGVARFEFVTDGSLARSAMALRTDLATGDGRGRIAAELGVPADALNNVAIISRAPTAEVLLEQAEHRLVCSANNILGPSQAHDRVNGLLRTVVLSSGHRTIAKRTHTVGEVGLLLGIAPTHCSATQVDIAQLGTGTITPRKDLTDSIVNVLALGSGHRGRVALWGAAGFGKTIIAERIYSLLSRDGYVVRLVRFDTGDDHQAVLGRVRHTLTNTPSQDDALSPFAGDIFAATSGLDVLICDNVPNEPAGRALAACIAPDVAVLFTQRSQHIVDGFVAIEVPLLSDHEVRYLLEPLLPSTDLDPLIREIRGWPLLASLVIGNLTQYRLMARSAQAALDAHVELLQSASGRGSGKLSTVPVEVIEASLGGMSPSIRASAHALGALRTSRPLPIELFASVWELSDSEARNTVVVLASCGIMRIIGSDHAAVHEAILVALAHSLSAEDAVALHATYVSVLQLCRGTVDYAVEFLPSHIAASGHSFSALEMLASRTWHDAVVARLGSHLYLSQQAADVFRVARGLSDTSGTVLIAAWLLTRLYGDEYILDDRVVALFAATRGLEIAQSLLATAAPCNTLAASYVALAGFLFRSGRVEAADASVRNALSTAAADADADLPDSALVTIQRLARISRRWLSSSVEFVERIFAQSAPLAGPPSRAVTASLLLPLDAELSVRVAMPLTETVESLLASGRSLNSEFGPDADVAVRHLLPVLGFVDFELGQSLLSAAQDEGISGLRRGQGCLLVGRILAGAMVADDELPSLFDDEEVVSIRDTVRSLAERGRFDDALSVAGAACDPGTQAVLYASIGSEMARREADANNIDIVFNSVISALNTMPVSEALVVLADIAADVAVYNQGWGEKLARQVLSHSPLIRRPYERVSAEASAAAVLLRGNESSSVDLDFVDDLTRRAHCYRPPRGSVSTDEALKHLEDRAFAAVIQEGKDINFSDLATSRNDSLSPGRAYWYAWSARLATRSCLDEAVAVLADPFVPTPTSYFAGVVGKVAGILVGTDAEPEWNKLLETIPRNVRSGWLLEVTLRRAAVLGPPSTVDVPAPAVTEDDLRRWKAGMAVLNGVRSEDTRAVRLALCEIYVKRETYQVGSNAYERARLLISDSPPRLPAAIVDLLPDILTTHDVAEILEGDCRNLNVLDLVTDLAPLCKDVSVDRAVSLVNLLSPSDRSEPLLKILAGLTASAPADVARVLCERAVVGPRADIDDWAEVALRVLRKLERPSVLRDQVVGEAKRRLADSLFTVETRASLDLLAMVAPPPESADRRSLVATTVGPLFMGPALCTLALADTQSDRAAVESFIKGLRRIKGSSASTVSVASLAADPVGTLAGKRLSTLLRSRVLDMWPAGFVGAAYAAGSMLPGLVREYGHEDALKLISVLRAAARLARH